MSSDFDRQPTIIDGAPDDITLGTRVISPWEDDIGIRTFLEERSGSRCEYYSAGKQALRDGLDILSANTVKTASNVVLPAYVPSALLEPIKDAGYEPRLYRITEALRPDLTDVEAQLDGETLAVLSVNYFGFPQPDHGALIGHAADRDIPLIEDNAHSALSMTREGTLLGTRGDIGFTSFRKTIPVPNGAALFIWRDGLREGPFPRSGIRRRLTARDARFIAHRLTRAIGAHDSRSTHRNPGTKNSDTHRDLFGRDPRAVYEKTNEPMSRLSAVILDRLRPGTIVANKRRNYQDRLAAIREVDGARPVFETLPEGTCPKALPVIVEDVDELADALGTSPKSLPRWPPLPVEVTRNNRFSTSSFLAEHLIPLPV